MGEFKLGEAIAYAKTKGKVRNIDLAREIWRDSDKNSARVNISNLMRGKTKRVEIDAIPIICKRLGVSADYLFGLTDTKNSASVKEEIDAIVTRLDGITTDLENIENTL